MSNNNGQNNWGVPWCRIEWFEKKINTHPNVISVSRHDDIVFDIKRSKDQDVTLLCLDEYTLGVAAVYRILSEFPNVNFIYIGGQWNRYTPEAKEMCLEHRMGLYNISELTGALWRNEFWGYHKIDDDGNPKYQFRRS